MILTKDYKDITNSKFDFYESIIDEIKLVNCCDLELVVLYAFEPYKDKTIKIIFKDCVEYKVDNKKVIKNKNEYNIKTIHQEIDEFIISDIEGLMVEIATNFEKEYIKLKCSGIWIDSVERKLTHQRKRV